MSTANCSGGVTACRPLSRVMAHGIGSGGFVGHGNVNAHISQISASVNGSLMVRRWLPRVHGCKLIDTAPTRKLKKKTTPPCRKRVLCARSNLKGPALFRLRFEKHPKCSLQHLAMVEYRWKKFLHGFVSLQFRFVRPGVFRLSNRLLELFETSLVFLNSCTGRIG